MIRTILTGLAIATPSAVMADVIQITSGEHDGFTRLVFAVDPSIDWSLQHGNQTARLIFPMQGVTFDESSVFDRIAKLRLSSTRAAEEEDASTFHMNLACDCDVKAYAYLGNYIVVDILDGGHDVTPDETIAEGTIHRNAPQLWGAEERALAIAPMFSVALQAPVAPKFYGTIEEDAFSEQTFTTALESDADHEMMPSIPTESPNDTLGMHEDNHAQTIVDNIDAYIDTHAEEHDDPDAMRSGMHAEVDDTTMSAGADEMAASHDEHTPIDAELAETVAIARMQLLQQLTMAAEQGLLQFDGPTPMEAEEEPVEEIVEMEGPSEVTPEQLPFDDRQLRVQSVYDRDSGMDEILDMLAQNTCPDEGLLNIASWGSGNDFNTEISNARSALLKEFDEPDLAVVTDLVHLYIRYGFGIEAITYLNDYPQIPDQDLLLDIAMITDGQSVAKDGPLGMANACNGISGLWALIGQYPALDSPVGDVATITEAFSELPIDIRRALGPRLSMAFLGRGMMDEASLISEIVERAPGEHGDEHTMMMADIAFDRGDIEAAEDVYERLINDDSVLAVDALIKMAEVTLEQGKPMTHVVLADLGAAADLGRGTEKGSQLRRLEALWLTKLVNVHAALTLLSEEIYRDPLNSASFEETIREILVGMSAAGDHETYVKAIDEFSHYVADGHAGFELRSRIGEQLMTVGLPNLALEILRPEIDIENNEGKMIAARANLSMYRPDLTLSLLAESKGDDVHLLRTEAYLALENFESALTELDAIVHREVAEIDPAWYHGNWKLAAGNDLAALKILDGYAPQAVALGHVEFSPVSEVTTLVDVQDVLDTSSAASDELAAIVAGH